MRLDKYISDCGAASRSEVKRLVKKGAIGVNGSAAVRADMKIDEESDIVSINGERLAYRKFIYLMLNKPRGYVSAVEDKRYPTVAELVPEEYRHFNVFPAGRLDLDTEGLLILTNDGALCHEIISPKKNIYKRYFAVLDADADEGDVEAFRAGMEFKDFTAKSAKLEITDNPREVFIEISEGKFHQVKRMCERVGKNVVYLKRVAIGSLRLDESLALGETRIMTEEELKRLRTETRTKKAEKIL